ncbi:MAG: 1-deoxy-D-xylulose-5-phosphate synthase [Clostridium sp.]|uniref:1-deoxy-D-xylulose-5-phosphate synthase n=1 Tax=Clostridium sp. DSM 8431 TaxID=1761781 RepID=UPI0008DEB7CA|nr:1-deoxy-D-xylulose-5-phosphate synthase [Clostridium sp. DSM 8431]MCR4943412.1 1-deoxy-D-xylulose-5-phosphate synthase [Clostridium sp.]SFU43789.1 1-deoxy-D-xylulose-5-phosphate synthase [Clostridium sp. DSM 8431]
MYLEKIKTPDDVKKLNIDELRKLAEEIRKALINRVSKKGGHVGPNLGMTDSIIALHYVFNSPVDKIVYDVSHQSYPHKMLTGRQDAYLYDEHFNDVSGYTNPDESAHDFFNIGHTSTSVSLASGLAKARDLKGDKENIIAVIGDGSLSGGEALEGLHFAGDMDTNFIIVVNDNDMSIAENHGGFYKNLKELRESNGKCECNLFKAMGLDYVYLNDGNDLEKLIETFKSVKDINHPIVVHINTKKGKGYAIAEEKKEDWHWHMPFNTETGETTRSFSGESYGNMTAEYLLKKMKADKTVAAIVAGVPTNIGFTEDRRKEAGKQFIDVGIAEEHAVALASGMAKNGGKPVFATHSSFMQRTYDQISQDLCINKNPATLLVNTASIYGMNDVTHLGIFDIPMMSNIPELVYLAPTNSEEYFAMLDWSIEQNEHPVAVRIPCNGVIHTNETVDTDYSNLNTYKVTQKGSNIAILALGDFYQIGEALAKAIEEKTGTAPTLINPRYITGIDVDTLESLKADHSQIVTLEDGILDGGFGEKIASFYGPSDVKVYNYGFKKEFIDRYKVEDILKENRITPEQIIEDLGL